MKKSIFTLIVILSLLGLQQISYGGAAPLPWKTLIDAIKYGNIAAIQNIVPRTIKTLQKTGFGKNKNPLEMAEFHANVIHNGNSLAHNEILQYLFFTILIEAIENGDLQTVQKIVPHKIKTFQKTGFGKNKNALEMAQHHASRSNNHKAILKYLENTIVPPYQKAAIASKLIPQMATYKPTYPRPRAPWLPSSTPAPTYHAATPVPTPATPTSWPFVSTTTNPQEFSVITANVLNKRFYTINFKGPGTEVHLPNRQNIFISKIYEYQPDVIALQEYNLQDSPALPQNVYDQFYYITDRGYGNPGVNLFLGLSQAKFHYPATFEYHSFNTPGANNNGFVAFVAGLKNNPNNLIGFINAHLAGGAGPHGLGGYDNFRRAQLQEILNYINFTSNQTKNKVTKWVICGDFNWTWDRNRPADQWIKQNGFNINDIRPTLFEQNQFVKKDYILSKGLLQTPNPNQHMEITPLTDLLTHSQQDAYKKHFSDHAILKTKFIVPPATPATYAPAYPY